MNMLCLILIILGVFFLAVSSIGVLRLPDFYTRSHAASKADTLGVSLVIIGLAWHLGFDLNSFKLLLIPLFMGLANPVAAHAMVHAAWKKGVKPFVKSGNAP